MKKKLHKNRNVKIIAFFLVIWYNGESEAKKHPLFSTYDTYGNIRTKKTFTGTNYTYDAILSNYATPASTVTYSYGNSEWKDQLTAINGVEFDYDAIGNPLEYYNGESNYLFTWQNGRQMASADCDGLEIAYEYDIDGLRTKKTIQGGETYYYYYSGGKLHSMVWNNGENSLNFLYDGSGNPYSFVYRYKQNGTTYSSSYYYVTNLQGDVIAILTAGHAVVAEYTYDAWGKILSVTNASGASLAFDLTHIANLNPLRYRGYVYDTETGLYYLQSRYYDPAIGRFINADSIIIQNKLLGYSQYVYCLNCPVNMIDIYGNDAVWLQYPDGGGGFGHTSLLIQNDEGQWYYFYWGAKSTSNKIELLKGTPSYHCFEPVGKGELNNQIDIIDMVSKSTFDDATTGLKHCLYIEGDFSNSFEYLNGLKDKKYRLTARNCVQTCTIALSKGDFAKYSDESKQAMTRIASKMIVPNKAFDAWRGFSTNIGKYKRAGFWKRLFMKNPYSYIP